MQALIQYPDPGSATNAKAALEGHAIYDGGYNRVRPLQNTLISVEDTGSRCRLQIPAGGHMQSIRSMGLDVDVAETDSLISGSGYPKHRPQPIDLLRGSEHLSNIFLYAQERLLHISIFLIQVVHSQCNRWQPGSPNHSRCSWVSRAWCKWLRS